MHMLTHLNRLEPPPGANCPPLGWSKAKGTSCCCSRYRLQQQLVLLAWTDGPFSSRVVLRRGKGLALGAGVRVQACLVRGDGLQRRSLRSSYECMVALGPG